VAGALPLETIGGLVLNLFRSRRPKTRYAAPFHTRVFLLMRWPLSDRAFDRMMEKQLAGLAKEFMPRDDNRIVKKRITGGCCGRS